MKPTKLLPAQCAPGRNHPVVLDTNILLDLYVFHDAKTHGLRPFLDADGFCFVASDQTIAEFANVLARAKFGLSSARQDEILSSWQSAAHIIAPSELAPSPWRCKDRDDQVFLDLAWTRRPAVLLSKDLHVLRFAKRALHDGVQISNTLVVSGRDEGAGPSIGYVA